MSWMNLNREFERERHKLFGYGGCVTIPAYYPYWDVCLHGLSGFGKAPTPNGCVVYNTSYYLTCLLHLQDVLFILVPRKLHVAIGLERAQRTVWSPMSTVVHLSLLSLRHNALSLQ